MKKTIALMIIIIISMLLAACKPTVQPTQAPSAADASAPQQTEAETVPSEAQSQAVDLSILGDSQRMEEGGFAFRTVPDYELIYDVGMVMMLAPDGDTEYGPAVQLMGWNRETSTTNETVFAELKTEIAFTLSDPVAVQVAGTDGLMTEVSGVNNGINIRGRIVIVMVTPNQQFIMMANATEETWQSLAPYADAVLASIEFFEAKLPAPVSNIAPGWYPYVNSNVVRDVITVGNVAYAATLGGMVAWHLDDGTMTHYTTLDGMGHISAASIVSCNVPEPRILVGTVKGISIFDPATQQWEANTLIPADVKLDGYKVNRLYCDQANQRLLIGYSGLGILDLQTGEYQHFTRDEGLAWNEVTDITTRGKEIWIANGYKGIAKIVDGVITTYTTETGMPDERNQALAFAPDGSLWVGGSSGLMMFKNNQWTLFGKDTTASLSDIKEIEITSDGRIWVATAPLGTGRLCQFDPATGTCAVEIKDQDFQPVIALTLDESNAPVYATSKGLNRVEGDAVTAYKTDDQLLTNFVDSFTLARDGMLWVGMDGGMQVVDPGDPSANWATYSKTQTDGLGGNWATSMAASPDGSIWVAIINGNASRYQNGIWTSFDDLYSFDTVAVDADQRAWFGDDGKGIVVLNNDGSQAMTLTTENGLPSDSVYTLLADNQGNIWIGMDIGLAKYANDALEVVFQKDVDTLLPNYYIRDLALAADGAILLGTFTALVRYDGNQATVLLDLIKDGYSELRLTCLAAAADGSVWVGTDKGLLKVSADGTKTQLTTADGLLTNYISALFVDQYGALWIGGGGSNIDGGGMLHIVE